MKKFLLILLCGVLTLSLTACGSSSTPAVKNPTVSNSNETPYKAPSANGGGTVIVGDHTDIDTDKEIKPSGTTSGVAEDYELEDDLGGVNITLIHIS